MKTFKKALSVLTVVFMLFCLSSLAFAAPSEKESTTAKAETEATTQAPETSNEQEKETDEETTIPEDSDAYRDNYNDTYGGFSFDVGGADDCEYDFDSESYGEKEFENFLKENTAVLVFFIISIILWSIFPIILIVMIVFIVLYCSAKNDLKRCKTNAGFNQYNQYNPPYGNGNYPGNGGWQR